MERLLDEGRIAPGLVDVAKAVRPRFAEPSKASDSREPSQSAEHYLRIWEMRFDSVKRTGAVHRGFRESLDCLRSAVDPKTPLRLLLLHNNGPLIAVLVEVEPERIVGFVFVDSAAGITDEYRSFMQKELSETAHSSNSGMTDFAYLRAWARWPDDKLRSIYSEVTHAWALRVREALGSEEERRIELDSESFPGLVRALQVRLHQGSQDLGKTIIEGSELADQGKPGEARTVYEAFIARSPSRFYRRIAEARLKDLQAG